jgi:hypothetical protein
MLAENLNTIWGSFSENDIANSTCITGLIAVFLEWKVDMLKFAIHFHIPLINRLLISEIFSRS